MTAPSAPSKRQPIPFGKYLLLDRINIGGMAEVWRGKMFGAGGFERLVAIKRILPNIAEDEEFISMFIDEAKISVQLNHANVAQIHELGNIGGSYFIAMEYIPGKDFRAIFDKCRKKGEPAPVPLTCYIVSRLCEGLDYAHRKKDGMGRDLNIVHRDISPQNVLVSYEGEVKVIDFGIAKAAGKATKTQAGILKGKFGYMSPEQIRGMPLDRRSDVFAIGVVLYELLTGERLFVGDSDFSVLEKVRKAEVLPPSTYNKRIPPALEQIVLRALEREVDARYQYASELADDLQKFLITSDTLFSRKDLMQYMKSSFAEEVEREKMRMQEYGEIKAPEGMAAAVEQGYGAPAPAPKPAPATIPLVTPVARAAQPPAAPPAPRPAPPQKAVSLSGLPKLTAAAPLLSNGADDDGGGATLLVDANAFNDGEFDAVPTGKMPAGAEAPATAAMLFGLDTPSPQNGHDATVMGAAPPAHPTDPNFQADQATVLGMEAPTLPIRSQAAPSRPPPAAAPPPARSPAPVLERKPQAAPARPAPVQPRPAPVAQAHKPEGKKSLAMIGAVAGAVLLVAVGLGMVFLAGSTTGHLVLQLPSEAVGKVQVNIDNQNVPWPLDENGKPYPIFILRDIKAGSHLIIVSGEGYEPWSGSADVQASNELTQVKVGLKRLQQNAQVVIVVNPETAGIRIDGKVVKREGEGGSAFVFDAPVGVPAAVEVFARAHETFTQKVTPRLGDSPTIKATLAPMTYALNVSSEPAGATIFVAGKEVGTTPAAIKVAGGVTELVLRKNCHDEATVPLQLPPQPAGDLPVSGALKKQPGCR